MHPFRVCVADDCSDEANILCEGLALYNYDTVTVKTGQEALNLCEAGQVDLLLLDVGLPDMSGYEVCQKLKQKSETAQIPVIFVTARGSEDDVAHGMSLGAADYIAKPYNLPMVMVRVDRALMEKQRGDRSEVSAESPLEIGYTDELTGLRNRRFLLERLQEEVEKAHRHDYPVSCLLLDVDDNGASEGEQGESLEDTLIEVAIALRSASRNYDILARYDGALFAAVLPYTVLNDAIKYANKVQDEICSPTFSDPCIPAHAKLSFGIVSCQNGSACSAEKVLGEAMRGLLTAKSRTTDRLYARDLSQG